MLDLRHKFLRDVNRNPTPLGATVKQGMPHDLFKIAR
jgi:hypothetical protein